MEGAMLWVEVLNQALEWTAAGAPRLGLHPQLGARLDASALAPVQEDVQLLRRVFAARAFASALVAADAARLSQWLAAVTLAPALVPGTSAPPAVDRLAWPEYVARRQRGGRLEPFESLLSTALVQLLGLPAEWLGTVVQRCHGLRRGASPDGCWPADAAARFAATAGLAVDDERTHQCPRLVWSARGSRFCSKACSNASFAARKARREPRYFAAKQQRYRTRRKRQRPVRPGAFVYMD